MQSTLLFMSFHLLIPRDRLCSDKYNILCHWFDSATCLNPTTCHMQSGCSTHSEILSCFHFFLSETIFNVVSWLFEFYVLETSKSISGWVPTCDSAYSCCFIVLLHWGKQAASTMTQYLSWSHYPDTVLTSLCPILLMLSSRLGITFISHWFDSIENQTLNLPLARPVLYQFGRDAQSYPS